MKERTYSLIITALGNPCFRQTYGSLGNKEDGTMCAATVAVFALDHKLITESQHDARYLVDDYGGCVLPSTWERLGVDTSIGYLLTELNDRHFTFHQIQQILKSLTYSGVIRLENDE